MIYTRFSFWLSCAAAAFPIVMLPVPAWAMVIGILLIFLLGLYRYRIATLVESGAWVYGWYVMITRGEPVIFWIGLTVFIAWVIANILLYSQFFLLRSIIRIGKNEGLNYTNKKRPSNRDGLNFTNNKKNISDK